MIASSLLKHLTWSADGGELGRMVGRYIGQNGVDDTKSRQCLQTEREAERLTCWRLQDTKKKKGNDGPRDARS